MSFVGTSGPGAAMTYKHIAGFGCFTGFVDIEKLNIFSLILSLISYQLKPYYYIKYITE